MRQIYPDLWQTTPEHPFGEHMSTHAYLLLRDAGNVLFYNSAMAADYDAIAALGKLIESLKLLRSAEVDAVFSSGSVGPRSFEEVSPIQWRSIVDSCIAELAAGDPSDSRRRAESTRAV